MIDYLQYNSASSVCQEKSLEKYNTQTLSALSGNAGVRPEQDKSLGSGCFCYSRVLQAFILRKLSVVVSLSCRCRVVVVRFILT